MAATQEQNQGEQTTDAPRGIFDEALVPEYSLPDPLIGDDGRAVASAEMWTSERRAEILETFRREVYGRVPDRPWTMESKTTSIDTGALGGLATRKQVDLIIRTARGQTTIHVLLYVPNVRTGPAPAFCALNFRGNHSVGDETGIDLYQGWVLELGIPDMDTGVDRNRATEAARGTRADSWPIERIINRGYAIATAICSDMDPDYDDGYQNGLHPLFCGEGETKPAADEWGTISAWAWGLSRMMDYMIEDEDIDDSRVIVNGLSRLGKTSLWAGAQDERFAIVVSTESGCGGAALSRRRFGETVKAINTTFPHWFCERFKAYDDNEDALPIDQHMLVSLVAPRPVYVASAVDDLWSDPRGEFLSALNATPVYELLGVAGMVAKGDGPLEMPGVHEPIMSRIGYHIRAGGHGINDYDWDRYMDFADKWL